LFLFGETIGRSTGKFGQILEKFIKLWYTEEKNGGFPHMKIASFVISICAMACASAALVLALVKISR